MYPKNPSVEFLMRNFSKARYLTVNTGNRLGYEKSGDNMRLAAEAREMMVLKYAR